MYNPFGALYSLSGFVKSFGASRPPAPPPLPFPGPHGGGGEGGKGEGRAKAVAVARGERGRGRVATIIHMYIHIYAIHIHNPPAPLQRVPPLAHQAAEERSQYNNPTITFLSLTINLPIN